MLSIAFCVLALSAAVLSAPVVDDAPTHLSPEPFDGSIMVDPKASPQGIRMDTMGDMAFTPRQRKIIKDIESGAQYSIDKRVNLRWDDAVIPYYFDCSIAHRPSAVDAAMKAMAEWEAKTCIRFVKHDPKKHKYGLMFFRGSHCWAYVGQVTNSRISIGDGCDYQHVMTHEIGHVVGMYHEQNRKDRDSYVNVHWNEIGQFKSAFRIEDLGVSLGVDYDYESIMHYPWSAFTATGKDTMSPKKPTKLVPYVALSAKDAEQTSLMYNCPKIEADRRSKGDQTYYSVPIHIRERRELLPQPQMVQDDDAVCVNKHHSTKDCEDWRAAGFCPIHKFMSESCRKTCFMCGTAPCSNQKGDSNCDSWAKAGFCSRDDVSGQWCRKSCATKCVPDHSTQAPPTQPPTQPPPPTKAPPTKPPTQGPTGTQQPVPPTQPPVPTDRDFFGVGILCTDKHTKCGEWMKMGECDANPGWMLRNCMLSCPKAHCDKTVKKPQDTCADPLGMHYDGSGSFKIRDSQLTSTDVWRPGGGWEASAANARLYFQDDHDKKRIGAWCPTEAQRNDMSILYMTIDLGSQKTVKYIATQGRDRYFEHATSYSVSYSDNGSTFSKETEVLTGNCDNLTPVLNKFSTPITARFIRIHPKTWSANPCMRMELYGC